MTISDLRLRRSGDFPLHAVLDCLQDVVDSGPGHEAWLGAFPEYACAHQDGVPRVFTQWGLIELLKKKNIGGLA